VPGLGHFAEKKTIGGGGLHDEAVDFVRHGFPVLNVMAFLF